MDKEEHLIETIDGNDLRNYTVIVELTCKGDDDKTETQIINIFSETPEGAFSSMLSLRRFYDQPSVVNVKLIGVYKRVMLKVTEGE